MNIVMARKLPNNSKKIVGNRLNCKETKGVENRLTERNISERVAESSDSTFEVLKKKRRDRWKYQKRKLIGEITVRLLKSIAEIERFIIS